MDNQEDSWPEAFENSSEEQWRPVWEKWRVTMREIFLDGSAVGYVFLSPKTDASAHLGYGLYKQGRGRGFSTPMCRQFLMLEAPKLDTSVVNILGTTLVSNRPSQAVLEKLGFELFKSFETEVDGNMVKYLQYRAAKTRFLHP